MQIRENRKEGEHAAGGAVLIAELLKAQGYITPKDAE
jgi:hypothetical protein